MNFSFIWTDFKQSQRLTELPRHQERPGKQRTRVRLPKGRPRLHSLCRSFQQHGHIRKLKACIRRPGTRLSTSDKEEGRGEGSSERSVEHWALRSAKATARHSFRNTRAGAGLGLSAWVTDPFKPTRQAEAWQRMNGSEDACVQQASAPGFPIPLSAAGGSVCHVPRRKVSLTVAESVHGQRPGRHHE